MTNPDSRPPRPVLPLEVQADLLARSSRHRGAIGEYTAVFLPELVLLGRRWWSVGEVEDASQLAKDWAWQGFTPAEARAWSEVVWDAEAAAEASKLGLRPEHLVLRLWYGRVRTDRPTLASRLHDGSLTIEEIRDQLRAVGLLTVSSD
jgi:hypothetical protein